MKNLHLLPASLGWPTCISFDVEKSPFPISELSGLLLHLPNRVLCHFQSPKQTGTFYSFMPLCMVHSLRQSTNTTHRSHSAHFYTSCDLRMVFIFLNGWKKHTKRSQNYIKLQCQFCKLCLIGVELRSFMNGHTVFTLKQQNWSDKRDRRPHIAKYI